MNKDEAKEKYGERLVHDWWRAYKATPPGGESGEDTYKRTVPYFKEHIEKDLREGKNVLVVGSHNNLRAVVKYIENISDDDISNVELLFGGLRQYEFNGKFMKLH
jgi:2,3-bisphosphoglycerate-dependent phosphoglycerate mutase